MSLPFNETCLNEQLLPKHTHTHTHTHIYIGGSIENVLNFSQKKEAIHKLFLIKLEKLIQISFNFCAGELKRKLRDVRQVKILG